MIGLFSISPCSGRSPRMCSPAPCWALLSSHRWAQHSSGATPVLSTNHCSETGAAGPGCVWREAAEPNREKEQPQMQKENIERGRHHPKHLYCFVHLCSSRLGGTAAPTDLVWQNGCLLHQLALLLSPRLKENWKMKKYQWLTGSGKIPQKEGIKRVTTFCCRAPSLPASPTDHSNLCPATTSEGFCNTGSIGHLPLYLQDPDKENRERRKEGS